MNCFLLSASSRSAVGPSAASHVSTPASSWCRGGVVLLHRRTECHQANGLLGLVCIYLYGVNSEPRCQAAWGKQALRCTAVRLSPASQHHCSEVLLLSLGGNNPWRSQSKEGSELSSPPVHAERRLPAHLDLHAVMQPFGCPKCQQQTGECECLHSPRRAPRPGEQQKHVLYNFLN